VNDSQADVEITKAKMQKYAVKYAVRVSKCYSTAHLHCFKIIGRSPFLVLPFNFSIPGMN